MSKRINLGSVIIFLIAFVVLFGIARYVPAQESIDSVNIPYQKNVEVVIEPAALASVQILYFVDNSDNEVYNFHLAGNAANFIIDKKYLHPGKQYSLYLVAFSENNIPSDPSGTVSFTIGPRDEIPMERFPPELSTQEGSQILEVK